MFAILSHTSLALRLPKFNECKQDKNPRSFCFYRIFEKFNILRNSRTFFPKFDYRIKFVTGLYTIIFWSEAYSTT